MTSKVPWSPITEADIWNHINRQEADLSPRQVRLWDAIRIMPEKWRQDPWGNQGGGFWAVGLIGRRVIWYNDIEDGFEQSHFNTYGVIALYQCNKFTLSESLQRLLDILDTGYDAGPWTSGPHSGEYLGGKR